MVITERSRASALAGAGVAAGAGWTAGGRLRCPLCGGCAIAVRGLCLTCEALLAVASAGLLGGACFECWTTVLFAQAALELATAGGAVPLLRERQRRRYQRAGPQRGLTDHRRAAG
jgi:hypothetical protein